MKAACMILAVTRPPSTLEISAPNRPLARFTSKICPLSMIERKLRRFFGSQSDARTAGWERNALTLLAIGDTPSALVW